MYWNCSLEMVTQSFLWRSPSLGKIALNKLCELGTVNTAASHMQWGYKANNVCFVYLNAASERESINSNCRSRNRDEIFMGLKLIDKTDTSAVVDDYDLTAPPSPRALDLKESQSLLLEKGM